MKNKVNQYKVTGGKTMITVVDIKTGLVEQIIYTDGKEQRVIMK